MTTATARSNPKLLPVSVPWLKKVYGGGGIVSTSVTLLGGPPGAGKTTLLLQIAEALATRAAHHRVLFLSNEQRGSDVYALARRIGAHRVEVAEARMTTGKLAAQIEGFAPDALVLDTITATARELPETFEYLHARARGHGAPVFLGAFMTKDGDVAGPRGLQLGADVLMTITPEGTPDVRVLQVWKNRYASVPPDVRLRMTERGLVAARALRLINNRKG
jgi:DNA repair protein RadA/Sms